MKPIKISVKEDSLFIKIAYFVDQTEVLERIKKIRKCWHLDKKLISYRSFSEWTKQPHYDFELSKEAVEYFLQAKDNQISGENKTNITERERNNLYDLTEEISDMNPLDYEIRLLLAKTGFKKYYWYYKTIALKAIVCGEVCKTDINQDQSGLEYKEIINDIKLNWIVEKYYGNEKPKPKIKRNRKWYWLWKNIKDKETNSYKKYLRERDNKSGIYNYILNQWNKECPDPENENCNHCIDSENTIHQVIRRYKQFLKN